MKHKIPSIVIYIIFLFLILEFSSRVFLSTKYAVNVMDYDSNASWRLQWIKRHKDKSLTITYEFDVYDPTKGWFVRPNLVNMPYYDGKTINSNSKGIRGREEYKYKKSVKKRILILGDSFTFGDELSDNETYPYYLQQILPSWEVINFGVRAYGHDQMLIYFREEGAKYKPNIVILGFVFGDAYRNIAEFRSYSKPRFELANGELKLKNYPVPKPEEFIKQEPYRLKTIDLLSIIYQKIRKKAGIRQREAEKITTAILDEMVKDIRQIGATPIFLYLPVYKELENLNMPLNQGEKFLITYCINRKVQFLSLRPYFLKEERNGINLKKTGHYGSQENKIVAQAIKGYIETEYAK